MKNCTWWSLSAFCAAVMVIGCGGGGGGGGGSTGGPGGGPGGGTGGAAPMPGQYLEFIGNNRGSNLDPLQLKVGDDIQVVVANYDGAGSRTQLTSKSWACSASTSQVTINSTGHVVIKAKPPGVFSVSCTTRVAGVDKVVQQDCAVSTSSSTKISGKVVSDDTNVGVKYVQITVYDGSSQKIGGARTGDAGVFTFDVPSNFDSFGIEGKTVPVPPFYRSFIYKSKIYAMDDPFQCPFRINVVPGQVNALAGPLILWLQVNGPPPPPDGCNQ